jgi:hypothetical protein
MNKNNVSVKNKADKWLDNLIKKNPNATCEELIEKMKKETERIKKQNQKRLKRLNIAREKLNELAKHIKYNSNN